MRELLRAERLEVVRARTSGGAEGWPELTRVERLEVVRVSPEI